MSEILSVFGIDWRILIIQMINFGILLLILWWFLYRPVIKMLKGRQEIVKKGVEDAEKAGLELSNANLKKDEIVSEATHEADDIVSSARDHGKVKADEIVKEAQAKSEGILSDAALRGKEAQAQLLKETEKEVAQAAVLAAEKILREK